MRKIRPSTCKIHVRLKHRRLLLYIRELDFIVSGYLYTVRFRVFQSRFFSIPGIDTLLAAGASSSSSRHRLAKTLLSLQTGSTGTLA